MRSVAMESVIAMWFVLVAAAFFAPVPPAVGTAFYGIFLVAGAAGLALRFLRERSSAAEDVAVPAPSSDAVPRKKGKRRG